jgi:uncharacterized protein YjeT (DUF2065 family)
MSGETLLTAVGLVLVLEGLLPLVAPAAWRAFTQLQLHDGQIRFVGLLALLAGLLLLILNAD